MPDRTPTQDEITRVTQYLLWLACAEQGHAPYHRVATLGDQIGFFHCECYEAKWVRADA